MTTFTPNSGLGCPALDDQGWDAPIRATIALLDGLTPVGSLAVALYENPSASLNVKVAPGSFRSSTGAVLAFAGSIPFVVAAGSTSSLWLTDAGTLASGPAWPTAAPYVPLAIVVTGASTIVSIQDQRIPFASVGTGPRIATATKTTTYAILPTDGLIEADATAGAFTLTLPSAPANPGLILRAIKVDATTSAVTVAAPSGQTVNGASSVSLASQWAGKTFVSDGTRWVAL